MTVTARGKRCRRPLPALRGDRTRASVLALGSSTRFHDWDEHLIHSTDTKTHSRGKDMLDVFALATRV